MTQAVTIDNVHEFPVTSLLVGSMPQFKDYVHGITPAPLKNGSQFSTLLGLPVREDLRVPPNMVAFMDRYGNLVGLIDMKPEPPDAVDA